jgi:hypothetical protein
MQQTDKLRRIFRPGSNQNIEIAGVTWTPLEFLAGPHHKLREPVPTYFDANQFTIDSDFGVFEASGNEMLLRRINEINAIAQLKDVSRTDGYKNALVAAAKSPVTSVKNIANGPVNTISNVPKGIMKFVSRAGESVKNIRKKTSPLAPKEATGSS